MESVPIVLIGAGNLAYHLGKALHNMGFYISQVYSRTEESAKALADEIGAEWTTNIKNINSRGAVYIVALKDSVLEELHDQLTYHRESAMWIHTSGSLPMDVWKGSIEHCGVLYPMQTFSKKREVDFSKVPVFIEAARREDVTLVYAISLAIADKIYEVNFEQRKKLHLAAVFASNFVNHMYSLSYDLLQEADIPFETMLPLIDETARKVHELSPREAQTGPAVRDDNNIIQSHLDLLEEKPDMQEIYRLISQSIQNKKNNSEQE